MMTHDPMHNAQALAEQTPITAFDVSAMVTARICHDLVSPLGAIGNGVELMQVCQSAPSEELDLIAQSASSVSAKLRLFRVAFGPASADQRISSAEIRSILKDLGPYQKHELLWSCDESLARQQVKLAFLLLMCLETALPWGGKIMVSAAQERMTFCARADRLKLDDKLWNNVRNKVSITEFSSARIQFALAVAELQERNCEVVFHDQINSLTLDLTFG